MLARFGPGPDRGWLVAAAGAVLSIVGWYEISGQPTTAQQLPYLASATIPGAALIVAGAVLIAPRNRTVQPSGRPSTAAASARTGWWALPEGSYLHRPDCPLLDGKADAYQVTAQANGHLPDSAPTRLCPVCEPEPPAAPGGPAAATGAGEPARGAGSA